jgi:U2 small nuclear ribonucleoprotein A'
MIENLAATQDQFDTIDLSDNEIRKVECMAVLGRLTSLLLNNNRATRLAESLGRSFPKLATLVLTNNLFTTLTELEPLAGLPTLTTLSLVDNPVTKVKGYRSFVIALLPKLRVLDFKRVKRAEREAAEAAFRSGSHKRKREAGEGEADANGAGGAAAEEVRPRAAPTAEQVESIKAAIANATSLEEVQKLEKALKSGNFGAVAALTGQGEEAPAE